MANITKAEKIANFEKALLSNNLPQHIRQEIESQLAELKK